MVSLIDSGYSRQSVLVKMVDILVQALVLVRLT